MCSYTRTHQRSKSLHLYCHVDTTTQHTHSLPFHLLYAYPSNPRSNFFNAASSAPLPPRLPPLNPVCPGRSRITCCTKSSSALGLCASSVRATASFAATAAAADEEADAAAAALAGDPAAGANEGNGCCAGSPDAAAPPCCDCVGTCLFLSITCPFPSIYVSYPC